MWKIANICPVYKKGTKKDVKNYRPISLLPVISKVFESCIYQLIIPYLSPQIYDLQHGFMKDRSTNTQLLAVYDYINRIVDERGQEDLAFLDLSKALTAYLTNY